MRMWLAYVLSAVPGALLALMAATGIVSESTAVLLFAPSFIGLNLAHMAATWGHAWLDGPAAPVERILIPAGIVVACLGLEAAGFGALLLLCQYWLSVHHAAMQNYGLLRSTQQGRGRRLDQAACVLLPLGALAYRARMCRFYDGAVLPVPPPWLAPILMGAGALAIGLFLRRERNLLGAALVAGVTLLWSGLLVGIRHPALPLYALASGHYVQQLYFVWKRGDFARGMAPLTYLTLLTAAAGAVVLVLLGLTVSARSLLGTSSPIPPWVAAMIGVNLSHYWLEHRIWRASAAPSRA